MTAHLAVSSPHPHLLLNYQRVIGKIPGMSLVWAFSPYSFAETTPVFTELYPNTRSPNPGSVLLSLLPGLFFLNVHPDHPLSEVFYAFPNYSTVHITEDPQDPQSLFFFLVETSKIL